jgi:ERCC4-type nuclease
MEGVHVRSERLPLGDFAVDGQLLVERKTTHDFAVSVMSGRLFRQVARLSSCCAQRTCLILEGPCSEFANTAISREAFQGALITVTLVFGLPLLRSRSPEETAKLIVLAAAQLNRSDRALPRRRSLKLSSRRRMQLLLLQAVPEIGPVKALTLLNTFENLERLFAASFYEIAAVPGIGQRTAARLRWLVS